MSVRKIGVSKKVKLGARVVPAKLAPTQKKINQYLKQLRHPQRGK